MLEFLAQISRVLKYCQQPKHTSPHCLTRTEHPQSFCSQSARYLLSQKIFGQPQMHNIYESAVSKHKLIQLLNGDKADIWKLRTSN